MEQQPNSSKSPQKHEEYPDANKTFFDILDLMECPVCLDNFSGNIYICETGHNLCHSCYARQLNKVCSLCKKPINGQRNKALEAVAEKMKKTTFCPFSKHGCKYTSNSNEVELHKKVCKFRQYVCFIQKEGIENCSWKGPFSQLKSHFQKNHQNHITVQPDVKLTLPKSTMDAFYRDLQLISVGDRLFVYDILIDPNLGISKWVVRFVGNEIEAQKWRYEFFINYKEFGKQINVKDICKSTHHHLVDDLFTGGHCMSVPLDVLKNFVDNTGNISYKILIRPLDNTLKIDPGITTKKQKSKNKSSPNNSRVFKNSNSPSKS